MLKGKSNLEFDQETLRPLNLMHMFSVEISTHRKTGKEDFLVFDWGIQMKQMNKQRVGHWGIEERTSHSLRVSFSLDHYCTLLHLYCVNWDCLHCLLNQSSAPLS